MTLAYGLWVELVSKRQFKSGIGGYDTYNHAVKGNKSSPPWATLMTSDQKSVI